MGSYSITSNVTEVATKKANVQKALDILGLLDEAQIPHQFVQTAKLKDGAITIEGDPSFDPKMYQQRLSQLFKKYMPHPVVIMPSKSILKITA